MATSGSTARITGLGTLLKVGSLAAIIYLLMKQYKRKKNETQIKRTSREQSYEHGFSSAKREYGQRIEIESPDTPISTTSAKAASEYRKIPIMSDIEVFEGNDDKEIPEISKESISTKLATTSKYNPSPGDMDTGKSQTSAKESRTVQVPNDALSNTVSGNESKNTGILDRENDELSEKLAEIEAIGCMAAKGNPNAMNLLFKNVENQNFHVRYNAIRGILLYGGKEDRQHLHETLPAGDWYILDIRQEDMRKIC
jgi:hypothetical protein